MTPDEVYHLAVQVLADHPLDDTGLCTTCRISPCRARALAHEAIAGRGGEMRPPYQPITTPQTNSGP